MIRLQKIPPNTAFIGQVDSRRVLQAFFVAVSFFRFDGESRPIHLQLTPDVETVEKVTFQKLIFEKWDRNAEKHLVFGVLHNISVTFWQFFSLLWEFFMNTFRTKDFFDSLVRRLSN
jgi:hypothetical protein